MPTRTHDTDGRAYLKLSEAREGLIELDAGFTCRVASRAILYRDERGKFYFNCAEGSHFLDGQANDGEHCIGVYMATEVS